MLNTAAWQGEALPPLDPPSLLAVGAVGGRVPHPEPGGRLDRQAAIEAQECFARPVALARAVGELASGDVLRGGPRRFRRSAHCGTPTQARGDSAAVIRASARRLSGIEGAPPLASPFVPTRGMLA